MSRRVHACAPDEDHKAVEAAMQQWQVRRMPVIDDAGHLVGVISLNDLARATQQAGAPRPSVLVPS